MIIVTTHLYILELVFSSTMPDGSPNNTTSGNTEEEETTAETNDQNQPNKVRIKACDLEIEAESFQMDVDELMAEVSPEMQSVMEYHLVGEYQAIEQNEMWSVIFE